MTQQLSLFSSLFATEASRPHLLITGRQLGKGTAIRHLVDRLPDRASVKIVYPNTGMMTYQRMIWERERVFRRIDSNVLVGPNRVRVEFLCASLGLDFALYGKDKCDLLVFEDVDCYLWDQLATLYEQHLASWEFIARRLVVTLSTRSAYVALGAESERLSVGESFAVACACLGWRYTFVDVEPEWYRETRLRG